MGIGQFDGVEAAPPFGTDFRSDVIEVAMRSCFDRFGYDISFLDKPDQDRVFGAVLDSWTDWPEFNEAAENAAPETLRSLAVAGGWEEALLD